MSGISINYVAITSADPRNLVGERAAPGESMEYIFYDRAVNEPTLGHV